MESAKQESVFMRRSTISGITAAYGMIQISSQPSCNWIAVYPFGSKVRTNRGELGIVMRQNPHFPERPVIRIVEDKYGQAIHAELIIDLIKDTTVVIQEVVK